MPMSHCRSIGAFAALIASVVITVSGCDPTVGGGDTGTGGDSASLTFKAVMSAQGAPQCTSNSIYVYQPVALTGSSGSSDKITNSRNETVFAGAGQCTFQDFVSGLRSGKWSVSNSWAGSCNVSLHQGMNAVTIQDGNCSAL